MKLSERAMLVYLSLRVWSAEVQDENAAVEVASNNGADANALKVVKQLMPKDWLAPLATLKGSIRTTHYSLTSPWLDNGYRIISTALYPDYRMKMNAFDDQWSMCVDSTLATYEDAKERGKRSQGSLSSGEDYPDVDKLRNRFIYSLRLRNVPDSDDFRMDLDPATIAYLKESAVQDERRTVSMAQAHTAQRLRDAVTHLKERIDAYSETDGKGKKLYESTVGNIQELVKVIPLMDLSGDGILSRLCSEVDSSLCRYGVDTLKTSASLRDETSRKSNEILDQMKGYGF